MDLKKEYEKAIEEKERSRILKIINDKIILLKTEDVFELNNEILLKIEVLKELKKEIYEN